MLNGFRMTLCHLKCLCRCSGRQQAQDDGQDWKNLTKTNTASTWIAVRTIFRTFIRSSEHSVSRYKRMPLSLSHLQHLGSTQKEKHVPPGRAPGICPASRASWLAADPRKASICRWEGPSSPRGSSFVEAVDSLQRAVCSSARRSNSQGGTCVLISACSLPSCVCQNFCKRTGTNNQKSCAAVNRWSNCRSHLFKIQG